MTDPDKQRSPMESAVLGLYVHAAQRIKEGATYDEIEEELMQMGMKRETAQTLLQRLDESRDNVTRRKGYRNAFIGAVTTAAALSLAFGVFGPITNVAVQVMTFVILLCGVYALVRGVMQIMSM